MQEEVTDRRRKEKKEMLQSVKRYAKGERGEERGREGELLFSQVKVRNRIF